MRFIQRGLIGSVLLATSAVLFASPAMADEPKLYGVGEYNTLRLEPAFAVPMNSPQTDHYHTGAALSGKFDMHITPWVDVFPSATFVAVSVGDKDVNGSRQIGTDWALGIGLRISRPHDYTNNAGHGWSAYAPWIDGQPDYIRTSGLNRFGFMAAAGIYFPTGDDRTVWTGPFLGFQQITDGTSVGGTTGKDNTDARIGLIGWGFEFGKRQSVPQASPPPVEQPVVQQDVPETVPTPEPAPNPPVVVTVNQVLDYKVQFDFDSAKLRGDDSSQLDTFIADMAKHPGCSVVVEGHASDEGHPYAAEHNMKLSVQRAQTVLEYLVAHGADASALTVKGFGTSKPIADNSTAEGRAANRRVEFDVTFTITYHKAVQQ